VLERKDYSHLTPFLLTGAVILISLYARPLLPVDETRYLSVAWDMHINNDWLVPHLNGEPYHHKPPLLFWIIRLLWLTFGVSEFAARLVAPIFGIGALWLTQILGRLLWSGEEGRKAGIYASLMVASASWWMVFSSLVMFDLMVAFFAMLGCVGLAYTARTGKLLHGMAMVAVAIGGGILAKGPVIFLFIVPVGLLAPIWAPPENQIRWRQWYGSLLAAVLAGTAVGLAWAIPAAISGGEDFAENLLWGQTVNRVSNSFAHRRSFLWYLPLLPLILFPWSIWPNSWRALTRWSHTTDRSVFLTVLLPALVFLCFCVISGKQPQYLLPLFPLLMLAIARGITMPGRAMNRPAAWPITGTLVCLGVGLLAAPFMLLVDARLEGADWSGIVLKAHVPAGLAVLAVAALCHWMARRGQVEDGLHACVVAVFGLFAILHLAVFNPHLRDAYDLGPISRVIAEYQKSGYDIAFAGDYAGEYNFSGRLKQPLAELHLNEVSAWTAAHPDGIVVTLLRDELASFPPLFSQAQRGRTAVLLPSRAYRTGTDQSPMSLSASALARQAQ
jgi:4-amino-4-deoxy-L-arabinose transferase and related glycosyltransferases of PMT family